MAAPDALLDDASRRDVLVMRHCAAFAEPGWAPAMLMLVRTLAPLLVLYGLVARCVLVHVDGMRTHVLVAVVLILAVVAVALLRVRLSVLFHDMAHDSFFPSTRANSLLALLCGATIFTPLSEWRQGHNIEHHCFANQTDHAAGMSRQTAPWTLAQFRAAHPLVRLAYAFFFGPLTLFTVLPTVNFLVLRRFAATALENALSAAYVGLVVWLGGGALLAFDLASFALAANIDFALFHVHHTFHGAYRAPRARWSFVDSALSGASFLELPVVLQPFIAGLQYHHIHHINPQVPTYRLAECHRAGGALFASVPRVGMAAWLAGLRHALYDERTGRFCCVYAVLAAQAWDWLRAQLAGK